MPAVHLLGANRINADVAGKTSGAATGAERAGMAAPPTISEVLDSEGFSGIFGSGMVGGFHPEAIPGIVDRSLVRATDSLVGPNGGLRPSRGSAVAPGPGGRTNAARQMLASVQKLFAGK